MSHHRGESPVGLVGPGDAPALNFVSERYLNVIRFDTAG
jgi:hypothetical protein